MPRAEPRARRRARRLCSAAPNRGGDGPRLRAPAVSRRAGGRRAARPRSKRVVPVANATAHERFAPSSTAAGAARGGKVALEATPRSPGPPGGEGERSRANGAVFGRTASRRDEIFRREGRSRCRAPNLARGDAPEDCARPRRIAAATGHAFERRRSRGAPAVDARRGRGRSASFLSRTRRRTSDSRRARRPPGAPRGGKVALEATPRSPGPPGGEGERRRLHTAMAPSSGAVGGHDSTKNSKRDETFFGEWSYNGRLYHKSLWSYRCIDRVRYRLRSVGVVKVISGTSCSSALTSSSSSSTLASSSLFPY